MPQRTRTLRAIVAIIVACGIAFININSYDHNDVGYQEHPIASILGSSLPAIIVGLMIYFFLGVRRNKLKFSPTIINAKLTSATEQDDWAFEKASSELEGTNIDKAVWARAYAECKGDENESKAKYISLHVERLKAAGTHQINDMDAESHEDTGSVNSKIFLKYAKYTFALVAIISLGSVIYSSISDALQRSHDEKMLDKFDQENKETARYIVGMKKRSEQAQNDEVHTLVNTGMSKNKVLSVLGEPSDIFNNWDRSNTDQDKWMYGSVSIYFSHGKVAFKP